MYKNKTTLGVITARGGSKGIPKKNIKELGGKPLIAWTIEAAKASRFLDYFLVSTDDEEIAEVSKKYGAPVPFMRPAELATDEAKGLAVVQHALAWLVNHANKKFDYTMILQPTSPLRTSEDIDACIEKIVEASADSVMSMVRLEDFAVPKLKRLDGEKILPFIAEEGKESARRQDGQEVYKRNCAVYLSRTELLMQGDLFGKISLAYVMPPERSVDINRPFDWTVAEACFRHLKYAR